MLRVARLSSSTIERILFDEAAGELTIAFRHGARYVYSGVPRPVYEALRGAASAGAYFNRCIKGRFDCRYDPARKRYGRG
jgi:hypothetical protein